MTIIFIGADHRGYYLKEKIAKWLFDWDYKYFDVGAESLDLNDDYTKYASEVASLVAKTKSSKGVIVCGSGVGVEITANKFDGVRAAIGKTPKQVEAGRKEDNMNVLVLAAEFTYEDEAREMLKAFLQTKFSGKKRYRRRLSDISRIEANN